MDVLRYLYVLVCLTFCTKCTTGNVWNGRKSTALSRWNFYSKNPKNCLYCQTNQNVTINLNPAHDGSCNEVHPACIPEHCLVTTPPCVILTAEASRTPYSMCGYCLRFCPACIQQSCYKGFQSNPKSGRGGFVVLNPQKSAFNMCRYCQLFFTPCITLHCLDKMPHSKENPGIRDMCQWCRENNPECIPSYCFDETPYAPLEGLPGLIMINMCQWCREHNPECIPLYCLGKEGPILDQYSMTTSSGAGSRRFSYNMVCSYCSLYYPLYVPNYCASSGIAA